MIYIRNPSDLEQWEQLTHIKGFEMNEEVNGELVASFTSLESPHNFGFEFLKSEALVEIDGREFRVKQFQKNKNAKSVVAISEYFSLKGNRKHGTFGGTHTFDEFAAFVFADTGWTVINEDVTGSAFIPNFGNESVPVLVESLIAAFEIERKILPGNKVLFARSIGPDNDAVYRYGYNLSDITLKEDTSKLETRIKAFGGNGLTIEYVSPNASVFGDIEAEPFQDERFLIAENLIERAKQELVDYPEILLEVKSVEITEKELGEKVWLIHEKMGIEFQTRVLSKKTAIRENKFVTISSVLGNIPTRRNSELLQEQNIRIDENAKQTASKFEQTNEKITLAVTELQGDIATNYAQIEITASQIRQEVGSVEEDLEGKITNNTSLINQTATSINLSVSQEVERLEGDIASNTSLINQTATNITLSVDAEVERLDGRVDSANSSISALAGEVSLKASTTSVNNLGSRVTNTEINISSLSGQISQKVSTTDYNGNTIASLINQSATTISLNASKIDLMGITTVANELNIGNNFQDSTSKAIRFRGTFGGVGIYSSVQDSISVEAINTVTLDGSEIKLDAPTVRFISSNVIGLYPVFG